MDSLLTLVDRWHAHERDGDPEASNARHALELRLAELTGYLQGVQSFTPLGEHPYFLVAGKP